MKILETERLILRPWQLDDVDDLYEYGKDDRVGPNAGWPPHESKEVSKGIIESFMTNDEVYAIYHKKDDKVVGGIGIHRRTPDPALEALKQREIGFVLNPSYWGRGLVPEAVKCLINFGFNRLDLDIIWCGHYDFNLKSKRVVEKCGFEYRFTEEKTLKLLDNKKVQTLVYAITKEMYANK